MHLFNDKLSKPDISVVFSSATLQGRRGRYAGREPKNKKKKKRSLVTRLLYGCPQTAPVKHTNAELTEL